MENLQAHVFSVGKQFARKLGLLVLALFLLGGGTPLPRMRKSASISVRR